MCVFASWNHVAPGEDGWYPFLHNVVVPRLPGVGHRQVTGVGRRELGPVFAEILRRQGRRALIVHSTDGLDEISPSVATDVWEVSGSPLTVREYQVRCFFDSEVLCCTLWGFCYVWTPSDSQGVLGVYSTVLFCVDAVDL